MKKGLYIVLSILCALQLTSCVTISSITRAEAYPKLYEEKPKVILIMPPINNTNNVEAKEYFYSSLAHPICERGYYVISPLMALDFLKSQSAYESEHFIEGNVAPFRTYLGADAVLFTTINKWSKTLISGTIHVTVSYVMRSTHTGETLFERSGDLTLDRSSGQGGLAGLVATMIQTGMTDKVEAARRCNSFVFTDLPSGIYRDDFQKDQEIPSAGKVFKGNVK